MVNSKNKGNRFEREAAKLLNRKFPNTWKRTAMSGALGTIMNTPMFSADLVGKYDFLPFIFVAEAKAGYGKKSMTLQHDWFAHIYEVADKVYGFPLVILRLDGAPAEYRQLICLSFEQWDVLMSLIKDGQEKFDRADKKGAK